MDIESERVLFVEKSASAPGNGPEGGAQPHRLLLRATLSVLGGLAATGLVAAAGLAAHRIYKAGSAEASALTMSASTVADSIPVLYDGHSYVLPFGADLEACRLDVQGTLGERSSEGWGIDLLTAPPPDTDIVLFFNGRPKTREVVRNARTALGLWGDEETSGGYPFPEKGGSIQVSFQKVVLAKERKSQWLVWVDGDRKVPMDFDDRLHLTVTDIVVWGLENAKLSLRCEHPALVVNWAVTPSAAAPKGATRTMPEAAATGTGADGRPHGSSSEAAHKAAATGTGDDGRPHSSSSEAAHKATATSTGDDHVSSEVAHKAAATGTGNDRRPDDSSSEAAAADTGNERRPHGSSSEAAHEAAAADTGSDRSPHGTEAAHEAAAAGTGNDRRPHGSSSGAAHEAATAGTGDDRRPHGSSSEAEQEAAAASKGNDRRPSGSSSEAEHKAAATVTRDDRRPHASSSEAAATGTGNAARAHGSSSEVAATGTGKNAKPHGSSSEAAATSTGNDARPHGSSSSEAAATGTGNDRKPQDSSSEATHKG